MNNLPLFLNMVKIFTEDFIKHLKDDVRKLE